MKEDSLAIPQNDVLVFAYGSNMCRQRILARTPSAVALFIGRLGGYRLAFHKRSVDGSAKADAFRTDQSNDEIWGVVYRLSSAEKRVLDQFESLGIGYDEVFITVEHARGSVTAWMYVARDDAIDTSILPYTWYHNYVRVGAIEHGLPQSYVRFIESFSSVRDPDHSRDLRNRVTLTVD